MTAIQAQSDRHSAVILVVERDPHVQALEAYFLEKSGYSVQFANDGEQALNLVESLRPDIVITEILVPKIDGLRLCRRIKEQSELAHVRVLVFSILAAAARARESGADSFLMKPLAEQKLVETVKQLLAQRVRTEQ